MRLKILQYKILHHTVINNKKLYKFKLKESPKCPFCQTDQTICHMFYECKEAKGLWEKLRLEYNKLEKQNVNSDIKVCLFNTGFRQPKKWNTLSLLLKNYIYISTLQNLKLSWAAFQHNLQYKLIIWALRCPSELLYKQYADKWQKWCPKLLENIRANPLEYVNI